MCVHNSTPYPTYRYKRDGDKELKEKTDIRAQNVHIHSLKNADFYSFFEPDCTQTNK
jgi:hypothetical protein